MNFDYGFDYHNIFEAVSNGNNGNAIQHKGSPLVERVTYVVIKETKNCQLREYYFNGEISCYEIHYCGEMYQKYLRDEKPDKTGNWFKNALKEALADFKMYSAC